VQKLYFRPHTVFFGGEGDYTHLPTYTEFRLPPTYYSSKQFSMAFAECLRNDIATVHERIDLVNIFYEQPYARVLLIIYVASFFQ